MSFLRKKQAGFTIVELLIVIVVIAILAAISIVAYRGIQNRANNTAIQSDLRQTASLISQYHAVNGSYPDAAALPSIGIKASKGAYFTESTSNLLYCQLGDRFAVLARSKSGDAYKYTSDGGLSSFTEATWQNSSANLCGSVGISSAVPGYVYVWMHIHNSGWVGWV